MEEPFIKTTGNQKRLSGIQKAAILLGELGLDAGQQVLTHLNLTPQEQHKITNAMKALGPYPRNLNDIKREEKVLEETLNFGQFKGIYTPVPRKTKQQKILEEQQNGVTKILKENPEAITNLIRSWLDD